MQLFLAVYETYDEPGDNVIGIFSTIEKAEDAIETVKKIVGEDEIHETWVLEYSVDKVNGY